jgi:photosystem II stability/assembly factor-like uncharacterized protein
MNKNKFYKKLTSGIFYFSILLFIIAFNFSDNGNGGWTQQFMPYLNNRPLADITFLDSLTGYAVTGDGNSSGTDTNYIIKTINSGEIWNIIYRSNYDFIRIKFLNNDSGYACSTGQLFRTTNAGLNWNSIPIPPGFGLYDMFAISYDTIWISFPFLQGDYLYRTTNAGQTWTNQFLGNGFKKIYFYNNRIGFVGSNTTNVLFKTTNSGINWISNSGNGFFEMFFVDSLVGWKTKGFMNKTTDGGETWINQLLPSGGNIFVTNMLSFSNINKDTIWGTGGVMRYGNSYRGMLYRTTNGGSNWAYQVPDTSIHLSQYWFCRFVNKLNGWVYVPEESGIHTTIGGDTTFITNIKSSNTIYPEDFVLYQNYPNPFNPTTKIKYELKKSSNISIVIYDILGKEISELINKNQHAGKYELEFNALELTSGIYLYSLFIDNINVDTKKMILLR